MHHRQNAKSFRGDVSEKIRCTAPPHASKLPRCNSNAGYNGPSLSGFHRLFEPLLFLFSCCCSLTNCSRAGGCAVFNYPFLTQKERDNETGLDYFGSRYHSNIQGRFTSPDPSNVGASEFDPQSWNGYAYVGNSPLISTDPDGLWKQTDCSSGGGKCWVAEKGDTFSSLAKILHVSAKDLAGFFQNEKITIGHVFDVSGLNNYLNQASGATDPNAGFALCRANGAQIQQRMAYDAMIEGLRRGPYADTLILFGPITRLGGLLGPASAANDVKLLGTARMNLLNAAKDSKLRNFIKYLYREGAEVGNGSTADAIRFERTTGQLLSAAGHAPKGQEAISGLNRLMLSGKLSCQDAAIAQEMINDLKSALK